MNEKPKMKIVYTVVERGEGRTFWVRIGVAFTNRDGSINIRLDAVPVNGTMQIRDAEPPRDGTRPSAQHAPARAPGDDDINF